MPEPAGSTPKPGGERQLVSFKEPEPPSRYLARNMKDFPGAAGSRLGGKNHQNCLFQSLHTHRFRGTVAGQALILPRSRSSQLPAGLPAVTGARG